MSAPSFSPDQIAAIKAQAQSILTSVEQYTSAENAEQSRKVGDSIVEAASLLEQQALGPVGMILNMFEQIRLFSSLRVLMALGVLQALPGDRSPKTAEELATSLKLDETLLRRILRMTTAMDFTEEKVPGSYSHTPASLVVMSPVFLPLFEHFAVDMVPAEIQLPEFFKANSFSTDAITKSNNPFTFTHKTNGKDVWGFFEENPERMETFAKAMAATGLLVGYDLHFPYAEHFAKFQDKLNEDTVLVVDIGGGTGRVGLEIREKCKDVKGKVIVQDLEGVVAQVEEGAFPSGLEKMGHDFFTEQPIKGALIYHFRYILHDWSDNDSRKILSAVIPAMTADSRIIISECVIPDEKPSRHEVWRDIQMLIIAGVERTESMWAKLLHSVGLKIEGIYKAEGSSTAAGSSIVAVLA